jgi:beta-galactosidase
VGLQTFADVQFDVRGVVQLAGRHLWREGFPRRVTAIPVGQKCSRLYFLHATGWSVPEGTQIANFVVHYADGRRRFIPVLFGQDVDDWFGPVNGKSDHRNAVIAWEETPSHRENARVHRLFKSTWVNPLPEAEITAIDYVSFMTDAAPFLIAISVEKY